MRWSLALIACVGPVVVGVAIGTSCSVEPRSDGFRCVSDGQCGSGRICEREWCVLGERDAGMVNAPEVNAFDCPSECSSCLGTTCVIDCQNDGDCDGADIVCPDDLDCEINCDGALSCVNGDIDCSEATDCRVNCDGDGSCDGAITCSDDGPCRIDCGGDDSCAGPIAGGNGETDINCEADVSCTGGVDCANACACDVECGAVTCPVAATCPPGNGGCGTAEGGCETIGACDTC